MIHGKDIKDEKVVQKVLRILTKKFGMVVVSIEECKGFSTYLIDELTCSLLAYESRINREEE